MIALSTHDKANLNGDLIEERPDGTIYIGLFRNGADETKTENCIIRRITSETQDGKTITRTQYPLGVNYDFRFTWSERESYDYQYNKSK